MPDNSQPILRPLTQAEQTASALRDMARALLMQAEALESTVPRQPRRRNVKLIDPRKQEQKQC